MTIPLPELLVAALATWHAVEVWHHSSLFAGLRARVELWEGFWGKMLTCPFCLSLWMAWIMAAVLLAPLPEPVPWPDIGRCYAVAILVALLALFARYETVSFLRVIRERWSETRQLRSEYNIRRSYLPIIAGTLAGFTLLAACVFCGCRVLRSWAETWGWQHAPADFVTAAAVLALKLFVAGLAVARLANLGNDLTRTWCRTPKENKLPEADPDAVKSAFEGPHDGPD